MDFHRNTQQLDNKYRLYQHKRRIAGIIGILYEPFDTRLEQLQQQIDAKNFIQELQVLFDLDIGEMGNLYFKHRNTLKLDEIYRVEQLQQYVDEINTYRMDKKNFLEELPLDVEEMGNYFENILTEKVENFDILTETEEVENFDEIIEEVVDRIQHIKLLKTFEIFRITNSEGICIHCLRKVHGIHVIRNVRNHWELYHGLFSQIYKEIIDIKMVRDILDQYIIMNNKLVCLNCTNSFKVKALLLNVEKQLVILLKHWHTHIGTSSDDRIKQKKHLREEFRRKLNTEEQLVDEMLENSGRDDQGQENSDCDENTSGWQLDELHPEVQQWFYEQYIKQMEQEANNIETQKNTAHKKKEKNLRVDELLKKYYIRPVQKGQLKCSKCNTIVNDKIYNERHLYLVRNHFEMYHGKLNYIYKEIDEENKQALKGYRIIDSVMWCTVCSANLNMGIDVESCYKVKRKEAVLILHWKNYHISDKYDELRRKQIKDLQIKQLIKNIPDWMMLEFLEYKQKYKNITSSDRQLVKSQEERDDPVSSFSINIGTMPPKQSGSSTSRSAETLSFSMPLEQSGSSTSRDTGIESPEQSKSNISGDAITEPPEQSRSSSSKDAGTEPPEQSESSTLRDTETVPSKQSGSSSSRDAGTDYKCTANFALSLISLPSRQRTPAQSPSKSDSSNGSPPAKQRRKEINAGTEPPEQSESNISRDAITEPPEQSGSSTSKDAETVSPEQNESSISIDAGADCKHTADFVLSLISLPSRQSTPAQSPSKSDSSNGSPPAKQRRKETSDDIDSFERQLN